jgi:IS1 family transposase
MLQILPAMSSWQHMEGGLAFEAAKEAISRRIRHVCEQFDEKDFETLVDRMAEIEVRYRLRDDWGIFHVSTRRAS